jgi:hypothetical protein
MTSSEYVRRSEIDRLKADGPVRCRLTVTYPMSREGEQNPTKFKPGQSGNPAGKPKGTRNATTLALETLLDGQAQTLTQKAIDLAWR